MKSVKERESKDKTNRKSERNAFTVLSLISNRIQLTTENTRAVTVRNYIQNDLEKKQS